MMYIYIYYIGHNVRKYIQVHSLERKQKEERNRSKREQALFIEDAHTCLYMFMYMHWILCIEEEILAFLPTPLQEVG